MTHSFAIRTITAGVSLDLRDSLTGLEPATGFLDDARRAFEGAGYPVQSLRLATLPVAEAVAALGPTAALAKLAELDRQASAAEVLLGVGPINRGSLHEPALASWAAELLAATRNVYCSVAVVSPETGLRRGAARTAAEAMRAISRAVDGGEANFRFGAAANVPAGTPFFPVAYHEGDEGFALGLESAALVGEAFAGDVDLSAAPTRLASVFQESLEPLEEVAREIEKVLRRRFLGIDVSPAPSLEASIAAAIESLTGRPFGDASTLAACAAVTQALQRLEIETCGYSGLMLPVLEDRVLARRAEEGRFGVQELLLYSSVCGTGLDVVPLPGDIGTADLERLILDVAALACRLDKPLAARLLPVPGKGVGDAVTFDNPHLTSAVVLSPDPPPKLPR